MLTKNAYGYTEFPNKAQAARAVEALGYKHTSTGQAGDGGYGSREYFEKPGCARNQYGAAMDVGEISRVSGRWLATVNHKAI